MSIDPSLLAWADKWYRLSWIGLVSAGAIAAVSAGATCAFLLLQWRTTGIRETFADQRAAAVELETAKANSRAEDAKLQSEELRAANLTLQKQLQPRQLGSWVAVAAQGSPLPQAPIELQFGGIKQFPGTPVLIQAVPDFEAQTFAHEILAVLSHFGWAPKFIDEATSHVPAIMIHPGIDILYSKSGKFEKEAQELASGFTKAGLTNPIHADNAIRSGIIAFKSPGFPSSKSMFPVDQYLEAVIVFVGVKPIYPVRQAYPTMEKQPQQ